MQFAATKYIAVIALLILQLGVVHDWQHSAPTDAWHDIHSEADCLLADTGGTPLQAVVSQVAVYVLPICQPVKQAEAISADFSSYNQARAPPITF